MCLYKKSMPVILSKAKDRNKRRIYNKTFHSMPSPRTEGALIFSFCFIHNFSLYTRSFFLYNIFCINIFIIAAKEKHFG